MSPGCGHNHTHNVVKLNSKKPFSKVPASITDAETKYIYRNRKGKMIFTPMFQVYKTLFTGEIVNNTRIKTAFNDFKDTAKYERYMLNAVQFSAAKTAAEGKLLQAAVFNENNVIKPFNEFKKDAQQITDIMNKTWLRTEYETARRQAVQGDQFARMQEDADLYPYWIYSGMMDDREREEHVELEGKVFRIGDPEGDLVFPPNGDNCRCTGDPIDAQDMKEKGLSVTPPSETKGLIERNVDDRFRYNPANEGILPKSGSYFDVLPSANSANWEDFSDMQSSEAISPTVKINELMDLAKEAAPQVDAIGQDLAEKFGGKVTPINFKSKERIEEKAAKDYGGNLSKVKDSVRNTVVLPADQIEAAVKELENDPLKRFTVKRQFHETDPLGYSGTIATFRAKNGIMAEIQVNTPEMIYAKQPRAEAAKVLGKGEYKALQKKLGGIEGGKGHGYYEDWRKMEEATHGKEMAAIAKESKEYYSNFLEENHITLNKLNKLTPEQRAEFKKFERDHALKGKDAELQERSILKVVTKRKALVKEYLKENGNVVNTDTARVLFKDLGYKGSNAAAVHEASSVVAKDAYRELLEKGKNNRVAFYAGGSGSGKTSSIEGIFKTIRQDSDVIMDGNLSNYNKAEKQVLDLLDKKKAVDIVYVYRAPEDAWSGVIHRMLHNKKEMGRLVPQSVFMKNTEGSYRTIKTMYEGGMDKLEGVNINIVDNSLGKGNTALMDRKKFDNLKFSKDTEAKVKAITQGYYDRGEITAEQYAQLNK